MCPDQKWGKFSHEQKSAEWALNHESPFNARFLLRAATRLLTVEAEVVQKSSSPALKTLGRPDRGALINIFCAIAKARLSQILFDCAWKWDTHPNSDQRRTGCAGSAWLLAANNKQGRRKKRDLGGQLRDSIVCSAGCTVLCKRCTSVTLGTSWKCYGTGKLFHFAEMRTIWTCLRTEEPCLIPSK